MPRLHLPEGRRVLRPDVVRAREGGRSQEAEDGEVPPGMWHRQELHHLQKDLPER